MSQSKTHRLLLYIASACIVIGIIFFAANHYSINNNLQKVSVGFQPSPPMAILMIAQDKGFFEKQGLSVDLKEFTAGKFALAAFFGGSLDFAVSGDVPPALAALQGNQFVVPAQLVKHTKSEVRIVAQKDLSLTGSLGALGTSTSNSDEIKAYFNSKKRKLATSAGGGPEFFTYEFLNKLGITKDQIDIVSQKPEDMVASIAARSVDAISMFDPVAYFAEKTLGDKAVTFTDESIYSELYVISAHTSVKQDPTTLKKFLQALVKAEEYLKTNPDESKDIVVKYTKLDRKTVDAVWGNTEFGVSLTPELLKYWNMEAQWAKDTGKVSKDSVAPDFKNFIFSEPLKEIDSSAVTI